MEYKIKTATALPTAQKIMNDFAKEGWRLDKFVPLKAGAEYVMVFIK
ncbi:MAG: hypothetical protein PHU27_09665 [Salinivirgaceae bacterium]|nr:hypothetical protein [Salinivirgaceae bacterium]